MHQTGIRENIVAFAVHLDGSLSQEDAVAAARGRGWLDDDGQPTEAGQTLVEELHGQSNTRTVFR